MRLFGSDISSYIFMFFQIGNEGHLRTNYSYALFERTPSKPYFPKKCLQAIILVNNPKGKIKQVQMVVNSTFVLGNRRQ